MAAASPAAVVAAEPPRPGAGAEAAGGRLAAGLAALGAVVTILAGAYAFAPQLGTRIPALAPLLESYRAALGKGAGAIGAEGAAASAAAEGRLFSVIDPIYSYEDPAEGEEEAAGAPRFVIVSASLVNMDDRPRPAPRLKATLRDARGELAAEGFVGPMEGEKVLEPRQSAHYFLRVPLREKQEVEVTLRAVPPAP